jgi:hypothetical protein
MKTPLTLTFALLLTCAGTGAAMAQTPDGQPPSQESVCDGELGAAYGLCNAYCEAMDCDSANPQASPTACSKVRANYMKHTGHDLPCEQPLCICQSIPQFAAGLTTATRCVDDPAGLGTVLLLPGAGDPEIFSGSSETPQCGYLDISGTVRIPVTPEQAAACDQVIRAAAASLRLTC